MGIDIEKIASGDTLTALKNMVLNTEELRQLEQYQGFYSEATLLTLVFSAKESFYKAAYSQVQRFFGFESLHFYSLNADKQQMIFVVMKDLSSQLSKGQQIVIDFCLPEQSLVVSASSLIPERILSSSK